MTKTFPRRQEFRQGDTTSILIEFDEPIGDNDIKVGVYSASETEVFSATLIGGGIEHLDGNTYRVVIGHDVTVNWTGPYYLDVLLKSRDDNSYVNTAESPILLNFKKAAIARNI